MLMRLLLIAIALTFPAYVAGAEPVKCRPASVRLSDAENRQAQAFSQAIAAQKSKIMQLYPKFVTSEQYDRLSELAFSLMAPETRYGQSRWYFVKKWSPPLALRAVKCAVRGVCSSKIPLSAGPTQIKEIPAVVALEYGISPASLDRDPAHAGIATIAFLIELRSELIERRMTDPQDLPYLNESTMLDHLVYFYQGKGRRVLRGERPHRDNNCYLRVVREQLEGRFSVGLVGAASDSDVETSR